MHKAVFWMRRIVAASVFAGFVAMFAGFSFKHLAFLAKWQFVPAVLAGSAVAIAAAVVCVLGGVLFALYDERKVYAKIMK